MNAICQPPIKWFSGPRQVPAELLAFAEGQFVDAVPAHAVSGDFARVGVTQPQPLLFGEIRRAQDQDVFRHREGRVAAAAELMPLLPKLNPPVSVVVMACA